MSQDQNSDKAWLQRFGGTALRALTAVAAMLGITFKAAPGQAAQPPQPENAEAKAESLRVLLQGSWSPPAQPGANRDDEAQQKKAPKFDDLGFLSHIDSGFNDFADR